ncbi:MAG: hypothetical protein HZA48_10895 [Planctomycetes bacterium]|nr:hypothetical protein [Planctomycetota bacterium]
MACSLCKSDIRLEGDKISCTNAECGLVYSVQEDIPNMLIEEAFRPCPACKQQRKWIPEKDTLLCEHCGKSFKYTPNY